MSVPALNVDKCVGYLRSIGVDLSQEEVSRWAQQQLAFREARKAAKRELKRSCGHFRSNDTTIRHGGGTTIVRTCSICGQQLRYWGASV